jgi:spore germination cell wall hydrolase CwlJ-like protein
MAEQFIETEIEKEVEEVEVIQPKKKQLSSKQLEHLNNIRVKALEKKKEIKLNKMKEYQEKNQKPTVVEEPIKPSEQVVKPEIKSDVKKKKVIKKVIKYVEQDSDDEEEEEEEEIIVTKKKGKKQEVIQQPVQQIEKSYNDLLCESSLERMQSKIMNERAKHLITHIIPNYY